MGVYSTLRSHLLMLINHSSPHETPSWGLELQWSLGIFWKISHPSSHGHGSGTWVHSILVSFQFGGFSASMIMGGRVNFYQSKPPFQVQRNQSQPYERSGSLTFPLVPRMSHHYAEWRHLVVLQEKIPRMSFEIGIAWQSHWSPANSLRFIGQFSTASGHGSLGSIEV